jgi:hypothetical protein
VSPRDYFVLLILIAAVSIRIAPAEADPIPYPDEFIGIWEVMSITRDCETQTILGQATVQDTICAGDMFDMDFGAPVECTGTITETRVDIQCEGSFEAEPGCTANALVTIEGTRNGGTWTSTATIETTFVGSTCPISEFCISTTSTGTLINPDPSCESAPVEAVTWGWLKHFYE